MKKFFFATIVAAFSFVSCEKALELDNPSLNAGYGVEDVVLAKAAAPKDTTTTKQPVPPADTTRSVQPADTLLPAYFGEPVEMGISLVPAKDTLGCVRDYSGKMQEFKAMCVAFKNGALVVVFEKDRNLPTIEEVKASQFVEGEFAGYNSGYDPKQNGNWLPAIAADESFGIEYSANNTKVRSVLNKTLDKWGWTNRDKNGNYSTVVDGYSYSVEDGKMTIKCNEETLILY